MKAFKGGMILACIFGLLLNLLLLYWKLAGASGSAGCGGAADCDAILSSRWSQVFGIPITALGAILYSALSLALLREKRFVATVCYGAIIGSATWLIYVQKVMLGHFCPWCMAAHGVGAMIVVSGLAATRIDGRALIGLAVGILVSLGLAILQLASPAPPTHVVAGIGSNQDGSPEAVTVHSAGNGRKVTFNKGRKVYDCNALPHLGSPEAGHVLVEYFDFQCPACHRMDGYLSALRERYPEKVCVLVLPVPLDHGCNHSLLQSDRGHPGSCELTRIALAVWRVRPDVYPAIHRRFISEPPVDRATALAFAREQVNPADLDAAMSDPWIDDLIQANIADWISFSADQRILPQLLINSKRILHGLPPNHAEFFRVMVRELGL